MGTPRSRGGRRCRLLLLQRSWCRLHAPDDVRVLLDGTIRGKLRHTGSGLNAQLAPLGLVCIRLVHPVLRVNEGREVVDHQVFVAFPSASGVNVAEFVYDGAELRLCLRLPTREVAIADRLEDVLQPLVDGILPALCLGSNIGHLMLQAAEDEHGVFTAFLTDLNVRTIHGTHDEAAVHHEFHVGSATGFGTCGGDVFRDVRGRDHDLRRRDAVVGHEGHLQQLPGVGVVVDDLANVVDEFDDDLRIHVGRGCLATNEDHPLLCLRSVPG
mmetsp:Transcript_68254/g.107244  ORF Transcript_68254/g.107244 Transcript_68254/m.107244 type:complete len:270 (+) Transcript_68254:35-844(+)